MSYRSERGACGSRGGGVGAEPSADRGRRVMWPCEWAFFAGHRRARARAAYAGPPARGLLPRARPRAAAPWILGVSELQPLAATKRRGGARALQRCASAPGNCCASSVLQRGAYGRGAHDRLRDVGRVVQAQMSSGRGGVEAIPHAPGTRRPLRGRLGPIRGETAGPPPRRPPSAPAFKIPAATARSIMRYPRLGPQ